MKMFAASFLALSLLEKDACQVWTYIIPTPAGEMNWEQDTVFSVAMGLAKPSLSLHAILPLVDSPLSVNVNGNANV